MHEGVQACADTDHVEITDVECYWLAGLLEGEGTFQIGPPSRPHSAAIAVQMTDADVIRRVSAMWDRAVVEIQPRDPRHKVSWVTRVRGASAAAWMHALRPLMGTRRRLQIDQALSDQKAGLRWRRPIGVCSVVTCGRAGAIRGLCLRHYKLWWKAKKHGRRSPYVPTDPVAPIVPSGSESPPDPSDGRWIAWLAGLLEGEGTFTSKSTYPVISTQMCDRDVIERVASLLGISRVRLKDDLRNRQHGWSPSWYIAVCGGRAAEWMRTLRGSMGARRAAEIDKALGSYRPIRLTGAPVRCVVPSCDRPHRSRGLCHTHYMKWDRDLKAGRRQRITPLR